MDQRQRSIPEAASDASRALHGLRSCLVECQDLNPKGEPGGVAQVRETNRTLLATIKVMQLIASGEISLHPSSGGYTYWKLAIQLAAQDMTECRQRGRWIQIPASRLIMIVRHFKLVINSLRHAISMAPSRSPACRVLCIALAAFDDLRSRFDDYCFAQVGREVDREVDLAVMTIFYGESTTLSEELFSKHCGLKRISSAAPTKATGRKPLKRRLIR